MGEFLEQINCPSVTDVEFVSCVNNIWNITNSVPDLLPPSITTNFENITEKFAEYSEININGATSPYFLHAHKN